MRDDLLGAKKEMSKFEQMSMHDDDACGGGGGGGGGGGDSDSDYGDWGSDDWGFNDATPSEPKAKPKAVSKPADRVGSSKTKALLKERAAQPSPRSVADILGLDGAASDDFLGSTSSTSNQSDQGYSDWVSW